MKILMAQENFVVGDIDGNVDKIINAITSFDGDLLVFSELGICGYPPLDLLNNLDFLENQLIGLEKIKEASTMYPELGIVVGYAHRSETNGSLYNRLSLVENGKILFDYNKKQLPTYNIFDEGRYFTPGHGSNLFKYKNMNIAFFICEDIWACESNNDGLSRVIYETPKVADIAISINASPSNVGKLKERHAISTKLCKFLNCSHIYVNQIGANDELVFDGNSFCMNAAGDMVVESAAFTVDNSVVDSDEFGKRGVAPKSISDMDVLYNHGVLGIRDYAAKTGFKSAVIGSSGGIDSAMVMALATDALGSANVVGITMPTGFSSHGSVADSDTLCDNLGIKLINHAIGSTFNVISTEFNATMGVTDFGVPEENMQARLRGLILMAYSNRFGNLVLSTGNKSEMSVGYATLYGDMNGGINPLGDMYKTEVFELAKYYNTLHGKEIIPASIINKEPSAELAPDQKDSNSLLPYNVLDIILKIYIEGDLLDPDLLKAMKLDLLKLIASGHVQPSEIESMVSLVIGSEYKRKQAPPIIRCQHRSFGFGRNIPVASRYNTNILKRVTE